MTASQLVGSAAVPDNPTRTGLADVLGYIEEHVLRGEEFAEAREAAFGRISKEWDAPPVALMETALPADWVTGIAPLAAAPADACKDEGLTRSSCGRMPRARCCSTRRPRRWRSTPP